MWSISLDSRAMSGAKPPVATTGAYADLSGSYLTEADLGGAYLENARFRDAQFRRSSFAVVGPERTRAPFLPENSPYSSFLAGADFDGSVHFGTDFGTGLTRGYADGSAVAVEVGSKATACSAACRDGGSDLPRFSARRSIPAHAVPLKKNRCGIEPFSSTCDNEHTAASLGHSEILGIEDAPRDCSLGAKHTTSVRPFTPCRLELHAFSGKSCKKAAEGVGFVGEDARDVFPDDDGRLFASPLANKVNCIGKLHVLDGQLSAPIVETFAQTGD